MLSGFPLKTKYTPGDEVYLILDFKLVKKTIASWEAFVDNQSGDGTTGRQIVMYSFENEGSLRIEEDKVFASENHALWYMRGDRAFNSAIESGGGGSDMIGGCGFNNKRAARTFGNMTDFAGWGLGACTFRFDEILTNLTGTISVSSGNYVVTGVGTAFQTELSAGNRIKFGGVIMQIQAIQSQTSLWLYGNSVSSHSNVTFQKYVDTRETNYFQGTVSIASGSASMTGVGTKFQDELQAGDSITLDGAETLTVLSIESQTALTTTTNAAADWDGAEFTNLTAGKEVTFLTEVEGEKVLIFDAVDLTNSVMPASLSTKELLRAAVKSYDAVSTKWVDGSAMGRP